LEHDLLLGTKFFGILAAVLCLQPCQRKAILPEVLKVHKHIRWCNDDFKTIAINIVGDGLPFSALAILAAEPPTAPLNLIKHSAPTRPAFQLVLAVLTSDGSTAITGYNSSTGQCAGTIPTVIGSTP